MSDQEWYQTLKLSISQNEIDGVKFPKFPDAEIQIKFTSLKYEEAINEAYKFYQITKDAYKKTGKDLDLNSRYLDFGVGWGRIARLFLRELSQPNIFGVDVNPEILDDCKKIMPVGNYSLIQAYGNICLPNSCIDIVTAFSVFSHLSPMNANHWMKEIHRVLTPGGVIVLTTLSSSFLGICLDVSRNPQQSDWANSLAEAVYEFIPNWESVLSNYPKDQMFYLPTGGGYEVTPGADYGWAMISRLYALKEWGHLFNILEFNDTNSQLPQAYFVMQKK